MLNPVPLALGLVLTLAAVVAALVVGRRADSEWAPVAVVGGGTLLGLAVLALAISVTTSATDGSPPAPPAQVEDDAPPESVSDSSSPTAEAASSTTDAPTAPPSEAPGTESSAATPLPTQTPTPTQTTAPTTVPTAAETSTPQPAPVVATEAAVVSAPATRYIETAEGGTRWRSACSDNALLPGWWPNGTPVEVMSTGPSDCDGWSLVRSGTLVSWVNDGALAETVPVDEAAPTPTPTPTPTQVESPPARTPLVTPPASTSPRPEAGAPIDGAGDEREFNAAVTNWIARLHELEGALAENLDRAVTSSDWSGHAEEAARLATAGAEVRAEIAQLQSVIAGLAPECREALAPTGEMADALVGMAEAYQEWLASGLVENDPGLRIRDRREAIESAANSARELLERCD